MQILRKGRFDYCSVSCVVLPRQGIDPCVLADVVTHLGVKGLLLPIAAVCSSKCLSRPLPALRK